MHRFLHKGMIQGVNREYHNNGQLAAVCFFHNSQRHGETMEWYFNGDLKEHSYHYNEIPHGEGLLSYQYSQELNLRDFRYHAKVLKNFPFLPQKPVPKPYKSSRTRLDTLEL